MTHVLIADDDHMVSKLLKLELGQKGFDITTCYNGKDAWEAISKPSSMPDIVLLDLNMPELNGFQVLEKIKSNKSTMHLPIVIISTRTKIDDLLISVEKGIIDYIIKPFTMDQILSRLLIVHRKARNGLKELSSELVMKNAELLPAINEQVSASFEEPAAEIENLTNEHTVILHKPSILIIENYEANKSSLVSPLEKIGYKVEVLDGYKAQDSFDFSKLSQNEYDIILIDTEPNSEELYALSKSIRNAVSEQKLTITIIGVGKEHKVENKHIWLSAGMNDYFQKPIPVKMVIENIVKHAEALTEKIIK